MRESKREIVSAPSQIRPARDFDLGEIATIEAHWPTAPNWSKVQLSSQLSREDSIFLVADKNGEIAGYVFGRIVGPEAQILSLSTKPGWTRQGVGREMIRSFLSQARLRGCVRATLEVSSKNEPALSLYRAAGFQVVGTRPKFYNDASDALLMDAIF